MNLSVQTATGSEIARQSFLGVSQHLQQGRQRHLLRAERQIVPGRTGDQANVAVQPDEPSVNRRLARQVFESAVLSAVPPGAGGRQPNTSTAHDVVAPEILDAEPAAHQQRLGCSGEIRYKAHAAAPSSVPATEQFSDLPQLSL